MNEEIFDQIEITMKRAIFSTNKTEAAVYVSKLKNQLFSIPHPEHLNNLMNEFLLCVNNAAGQVKDKEKKIEYAEYQFYKCCSQIRHYSSNSEGK